MHGNVRNLIDQMSMFSEGDIFWIRQLSYMDDSLPGIDIMLCKSNGTTASVLSFGSLVSLRLKACLSCMALCWQVKLLGIYLVTYFHRIMANCVFS